MQQLNIIHEGQTDYFCSPKCKKSKNLTCVIVIGDASPTKTKDKVISRRKNAGTFLGFGDSYDWTKHQFCKNETYYKDAVKKLKA